MAVSDKYRANLRTLPIATINETWDLLTDKRQNNEDPEYMKMITEVIDAYMAELMDRAEADHRRWIIMRSAFGIKAEPGAGSARYSYRAGQYVADCLHCGEDIKTATGSDYRVKWVHLGTESVYCGEWDNAA